MKKVSVIVFALCAGLILASCSGVGGSDVPKANLKSESDSLAYSIGISNTFGFKRQLVQSGLDSTYMDDFIKGLMDAASVKDSQKLAYFMGLQYGQQYSDENFNQFNARIFDNDSTKYLSKDQFMAGIVAGITEKNIVFEAEKASAYLQTTMERIQAQQAETKYGENKAAGVKYLEENKAKEGVVTLPSGVQYKIIKVGKGAIPTANDRVKVHYTGTLVDGTKFDSSHDRKEPTTFAVTQVVPGWTEILQLMPVGSQWEVYIPQELGYGAREQGLIKPFSTLVFDVELLDIEPAAPIQAPNVQPAPAN